MSFKTQVFQVFILCRLVIGLKREQPIIKTDVGLIRGVRATDGNYSMYMGIPYAVVDEDNPFGESSPYSNFNETFEAYDDSAMCPQIFEGESVGSLDCLQLNVYVPYTANTTNRLPVMVYIHGGGFEYNFAGRYLFGPTYLLRHDVILVTLNYRLGPYGFMCTDVPEVSGNQGLRDQLLALRWVKNNIKAFGGDVNKITLFGQSAGGFSVHLHLMSPRELLYNKIIIQSGVRAVAPDVIGSPDNSVSLKLAQYLGCKTSDVHEALSFLAKSDTNSVVEAVKNLSLLFAPCKELELDGVDPFMTAHYFKAEVTKVKDMPVLIGFNEQEMAESHVKNADYSESMALISRYLNQTFDMDNKTLEDIKTIIGHFYFGDNGSDVNLTLETTNFDSDYAFNHPIQTTIAKYLKSGPQNIFYYMFSYKSDLNALPYTVSHSDELRYLFDMSLSLAANRTLEDRITTDRMTTMWTNFAKYSDPTPNKTAILRVKWLPLTKESFYYLNIDKKLNLGRRPLHQRMTFWDMFDKLIPKTAKTK